MRGCVEAPRKQFFFEKKNQKTFTRLDECTSNQTLQRSKSFLFLFFKKEILPCFLADARGLN
jgi:hypothetical protein